MCFVLYTRRGCHLCEQAEDLLATLGLAFRSVEVDRDPALAGRFGLRVPVLEAGGRIVMEGRFDAAGLARLPSEPQIEAATGERIDETGG